MKTPLKFAACLFAGVVVATLMFYPTAISVLGRDTYDRWGGWIACAWIIFGAGIGGWLGYRSDADIKKFLRFQDRGPFTLNGFGTTFYGKRDFCADGSYVTTEWIVLLYFPVIPIRSLRVKYNGPGEHRWYLGFGSSESYTVLEKRFPPNLKQVLFTYSYLAFMTGWIYFVFTRAVAMFPHALDAGFGVTLIFIVGMLPVPTPWVLQHFAEKGVFERYDG